MDTTDEQTQQCDPEALKRKIEQLRQRLAASEAREKELHQAIEQFWAAQCGDHACACDEHPECVHTLNAYALRDKAIKLDADNTAVLEAYVAEHVREAVTRLRTAVAEVLWKDVEQCMSHFPPSHSNTTND